MSFLDMTFPISGVTTNVLLPPLVALIIAFFSSMGGISGAFLLLPYQMSVLNYTAPSVSGTNHVFNIVSIPSGVYQYIKEGRMVWPLSFVLIAGTLPGVFLGYYLRVLYLPDPKVFKLFVGCVLLSIGIRLVRQLLGGKGSPPEAIQKKLSIQTEENRDARERSSSQLPSGSVVKIIGVSLKKVEYEFQEDRFSFSTIGMFALALAVGIIGGAYGIGGGSIIAPFCVTFFHLSVYTIAGATLLATFITSAAGALFFSIGPAVNGMSSMPDWPLGILFGIGGFLGTYIGARTQKYVSQKLIKAMISVAVIALAMNYILQFFLK